MKLKKGRILILSGLSILNIFFGGALDLYGQGGKTWMGNDLDRQIKAARLNLGPFRIRTNLYLTDAGYDSNVYRTSNNPIRDFSITLGPGFYVYLPIEKKIVISIYESPRYVYFAETKRERTWNNYFSGQVHFVLNRIFITLGKGYSIARQIWSTEIDVRPQRKEDNSRGSLLWQLSKRTSLFFGFSRAKYEYEDLSFGEFKIKNALDRTEDRGDFTGYYRISYRTMFFLNVQSSQYKFQNPLHPRDSKSYGIYSGFEFLPLGVFRGRIQLGYKYFNVLNPGINNYRGIVGDTDISIRVVRPLTIRANYRRGVQLSTYDYAYYIESIIGSGASVYLSRNIRLDYNYNFGRNSYPATIVGQSSPQTRKDSYENQSAGIYFRVKKNIGLGVIGSLWQRLSSVYWANTKQTMIGINLIYDFNR